jgi:hypothetical protein
MTPEAQKYRNLVNRLEALLREEGETQPPGGGGYKGPELRIGDIDPSNGRQILDALVDSGGIVVRDSFGGIVNVKYGPPSQGPKVEPPPGITPNLQDPAQVNVPVPDVNVAPDVAPSPQPTPDQPQPQPNQPCGPEVLAKIKAMPTFNQAFALARKSGCPDFEWCELVKIQDVAPSPQPQVPNPPSTVFNVDSNKGNPGDVTSVHQGSSLPPMPENLMIPRNLDLDRMIEIAGTEVIYEAGSQVPEIRAGNKQKAIEIARKRGLKVFRYCNKFKVAVDKKKKQDVAPSPQVPNPPSTVFNVDSNKGNPGDVTSVHQGSSLPPGA